MKVRTVVMVVLMAMAAAVGCKSKGAVEDGGLAVVSHEKRGFETFVGSNNKLWVFRSRSAAATAYAAEGPPSVSYTRVGVGPHGLDVAGPNRETVEAYLRR